MSAGGGGRGISSSSVDMENLGMLLSDGGGEGNGGLDGPLSFECDEILDEAEDVFPSGMKGFGNVENRIDDLAIGFGGGGGGFDLKICDLLLLSSSLFPLDSTTNMDSKHLEQ
jgi:hypothetical protein